MYYYFLAKEIDNRENRISFIATDISTHALDIAKQNASNLKVKNINFKSENLINKFWLSNESLIIANLPYIPSKMYQELQPSVKDYEPKIALEGGRDGLSYYKKLFSIIEKSEKEVDLLIEIEPTTLSAFKKILENKQIKKYIKITEARRDSYSSISPNLTLKLCSTPALQTLTSTSSPTLCF